MNIFFGLLNITLTAKVVIQNQIVCTHTTFRISILESDHFCRYKKNNIAILTWQTTHSALFVGQVGVKLTQSIQRFYGRFQRNTIIQQMNTVSKSIQTFFTNNLFKINAINVTYGHMINLVGERMWNITIWHRELWGRKYYTVYYLFQNVSSRNGPKWCLFYCKWGLALIS